MKEDRDLCVRILVIIEDRTTQSMENTESNGVGIIMPRSQNIENTGEETGNEGDIIIENGSSEACYAICCSMHCVMVPNMAMR
jgi:hypothetical protein